MTVKFSTDPLPVVNQGERHVPAVLLVDTSGSMAGAPIDELNRGLVEFGQALAEDSLAFGRVEACVISFSSSVHIEMGFRPASDYQAPTLSAGGLTSLNEAIEAGLDEIESRKSEYRSQGIPYCRPWLFVLTDGVPTDIDKEAYVKNRLRQHITDKKVVYMPMGIGAGADTSKLQEYYPEDTRAKIVLKANASNFKEAFVWLSQSLSVVSQSDPNISNQVNLPPAPSIITVGI